MCAVRTEAEYIAQFYIKRERYVEQVAFVTAVTGQCMSAGFLFAVNRPLVELHRTIYGLDIRQSTATCEVDLLGIPLVLTNNHQVRFDAQRLSDCTGWYKCLDQSVGLEVIYDAYGIFGAAFFVTAKQLLRFVFIAIEILYLIVVLGSQLELSAGLRLYGCLIYPVLVVGEVLYIEGCNYKSHCCKIGICILFTEKCKFLTV